MPTRLSRASWTPLLPYSDRKEPPRTRIIAAALGELGDHVVGPIRCACLPTVTDHVLHPALAHQWAHRAFVVVEVGIHVFLDILTAQFVHLKSRALRGCGMVSHS